MLEVVSALDLRLPHYVNSFVESFSSGDLLLAVAESNQLFKGAFLMMLFWDLWFWRPG